jgi:hypothetical protein
VAEDLAASHSGAEGENDRHLKVRARDVVEDAYGVGGF